VSAGGPLISFPPVPAGEPPRDFVGYGERTPEFAWPDGARVAVNVILNYQEGAELSLRDGDGVNDTWGEYSYEIGPEVLDIGTETHYEYGSRAGVWRLARLFDEHDVPVTIGACALALERNPAFCEWLRGRDHDIIGHGYRYRELHHATRAEERDQLLRAVASIQHTTGQRIEGWYLRGFPTGHTRELLLEEGGFLYDSDAANDDLPYYVPCKGEPFLVVPTSTVFSDVRYLIAPTCPTPHAFATNLKLAIDFLLGEAQRGHGSRLLTVVLHARWSGTPNRVSAVHDLVEHVRATEGVEFMRRIDIARFWHATFPATPGPR
jgi:peptidoglycan/xylan/chitin deacetylase (PgdA/CDA1 family)